MTRERITEICQLLEVALTQPRGEPLLFLFGRFVTPADEVEYAVRDVALTDPEDARNIQQLVQKFTQRLRSELDGDDTFKEIDDSDEANLLLSKLAESSETELLKGISLMSDATIDFTNFIKTKYAQRCLIIDVPLDAARSERVLLFKKIKGNYSLKKNQFFLNPFDSRRHVKIVDNRQDVALDDNFEFAAFVSNNETRPAFFVIRNRNLFEDIFEYHEKYKRAFETLSRQLNFINWSSADGTVALMRQCYGLSKFNQLAACQQGLIEQLKDNNDNPIKRAFTQKRIDYSVQDAAVSITPSGTLQLKALLKIIKDGLVKTHMLGREGIAGDFEEISS